VPESRNCVAQTLQCKTKVQTIYLEIAPKEGKFSGCIVSADGVETSPKIAAINEAMEFPNSISELRTAIGLAFSHHAFCPNVSNIAEPLIECFRNGVQLQQTEKRLEALKKQTVTLSNPSVLTLLNDGGGYVLGTDANLFSPAARL
jgi:hypothetical protein